MKAHAPPLADPTRLRAGMRPGGLDAEAEALPSVVVVDPRFDAYGPLAASARQGKLSLRFRASGADALRVARRTRVDAWLIASELDDMSGSDFVALLREELRADPGGGGAKLVMVEPARPGGRQWTISECGPDSPFDAVLAQPVAFEDLERILGLGVEERPALLTLAALSSAFVTLPVGIGAAAIALALLLTG